MSRNKVELKFLMRFYYLTFYYLLFFFFSPRAFFSNVKKGYWETDTNLKCLFCCFYFYVYNAPEVFAFLWNIYFLRYHYKGEIFPMAQIYISTRLKFFRVLKIFVQWSVNSILFQGELMQTNADWKFLLE